MTVLADPVRVASFPSAVEAAAPPARAPWTCAFTINGRFYSQAITGVQRYGREITLAMDALLRDANGRGSLLTPSDARGLPALDAIRVTQAGGFKGHVWEQLMLPSRADRPILNLCNTGPAVAVPQVVCMHDANVFSEPDSYSPTFRMFYRALLPRLVRNAIGLTSVSKASCVQLASFLPVAAKDILVVPNGHEHVFRWNASASRLARPMADCRPFVLLLGSRARHKNAESILRLAGTLDDLGLDLVVAGGVAGIFSKTSPILGSNIRWLGVVSDDDLAFLYSHAFCLAFPSRSEGFGLPIVEAMALNCPVVSSNWASMPEVCGSAALLAAPDDLGTWRAHFAALVRSSDLRAELQERGRAQVREFSWAASARIYLGLFGGTA